MRLFLFAEFFVKNSSKPLCTALSLLGELFVKSFSFVLINKENQLFFGFSEFTKVLSTTFFSHEFTSLLLTILYHVVNNKSRLLQMKTIQGINFSLPFCVAGSGSTMRCYLNVANAHLPRTF